MISTLATTAITLALTWLAWQPESDSDPVIEERMRVTYQREDFQDRSDAMAPTLVYDKTFFERFEPSSVGDILKRIPGITGSADAGEFEVPQLRGLEPRHTQILINGERLPGADNDRTVTIDRIPAELVERIEIQRAPDASTDAQGIGGTINIVLKETAAESGLELLTGARFYQADDKTRGQSAITWRGTLGTARASVSASWLNRHNPKVQTTDLRDESGASIFKDERNVLDAKDLNIQTSLRWELAGGGAFELGGFLFDSDRTEREMATLTVLDFPDPPDGEDGEDDGSDDDEGDGQDGEDDEGDGQDGEDEEGEDDDGGTELPEDETIFDDTDDRRRNWRLRLGLELPIAGSGTLRLGLSHDDLEVDEHADIGSIDEEGRQVEEVETDRTRDHETRFRAASRWALANDHLLHVGLDLSEKRRKSRRRFFEFDEGASAELERGGVFAIEARRVDLFATDTWEPTKAHHVQIGLRLEHTRLDMPDAQTTRDRTELFPSIHYRHRVSPYTRIHFSAARTTTRPDFQNLQPFPQRDEPIEGFTTFGNPNLEAETALGLDAGITFRFAKFEGVVGGNLYYRDIRDHVEAVQREGRTLEMRNIGDGEAYGLELDLGLPLIFVGLPNVSFFANLALQHSEVVDPITGRERGFNLQADHVINTGFLHSFPQLGLTWGANWISQGDVEENLATEKTVISTGDALEVLVEYRWAERWSLRLTGRNLNDGANTVAFSEFDGLLTESDITESGFESERSGRSFFLVLRVQDPFSRKGRK